MGLGSSICCPHRGTAQAHRSVQCLPPGNHFLLWPLRLNLPFLLFLISHQLSLDERGQDPGSQKKIARPFNSTWKRLTWCRCHLLLWPLHWPWSFPQPPPRLALPNKSKYHSWKYRFPRPQPLLTHSTSCTLGPFSILCNHSGHCHSVHPTQAVTDSQAPQVRISFRNLFRLHSTGGDRSSHT